MRYGYIAILLDINSQFFLIKRLVIQKTSFFIRRKNDISVRSEQKVKAGYWQKFRCTTLRA
ncbi:hypothetical protein C9F08_16815 [Salmonella enterica subsp. enterica serovar Enteritidis]|uniref:Uncharacterized protein n=1 Tax=Salmonella enteritidis TaxID=149539 RepID=A0A5R1YV17_SALEN|nr:hypothetical protein C9F08_16815 [Salmonella enterica subsp. enterica serovar Enteritidis]